MKKVKSFLKYQVNVDLTAYYLYVEYHFELVSRGSPSTKPIESSLMESLNIAYSMALCIHKFLSILYIFGKSSTIKYSIEIADARNEKRSKNLAH